MTTATLTGCDFDSMTSKALNGKSIIALVTDSTGADLVAIAGQQGLSYNMTAETTEAATKDTDTDGWTLHFHSSKGWDASIDGLYCPTDEGTKMVAAALYNDEYLCLKVCERSVATDGSVTYEPLRMGIAVVTSDNFEAPNDDNSTFSMEFQGSGKPWLRETATDEEIAAATWTVAADASATTSGEG